MTSPLDPEPPPPSDARSPEARGASDALSAQALEARAARRAALPRMRGAIALGRERLRGAALVRLGIATAAVITLGSAAAALALRLEDGAAPPGGLLGAAARWLAWGAAGPIAISAAHDRPSLDRRDGIEALAAARGLSRASLHAARSLAAMLEIARVIVLPSLLLAALSALLSDSVRLGLAHLAVGVALALFGGVAGVTLGGLAAASGRLGGPRGRSVFAALILAPWAVAGLAGVSTWSIPGALEAFLSFAIRSAGGAPG